MNTRKINFLLQWNHKFYIKPSETLSFAPNYRLTSADVDSFFIIIIIILADWHQIIIFIRKRNKLYFHTFLSDIIGKAQ